MVEKMIFGLLLLIYATGCLASVVEIYEQQRDGIAPSGKELAALHPIVNIACIVLLVASWPLVITWWCVRSGWK